MVVVRVFVLGASMAVPCAAMFVVETVFTRKSSVWTYSVDVVDVFRMPVLKEPISANTITPESATSSDVVREEIMASDARPVPVETVFVRVEIELIVSCIVTVLN